jgi:hypothetical protein
MKASSTLIMGLALILGLLSGCSDTSPPGGGLTNGPEPATSDEKPAMRTDLPPPTAPKQGEVLGELGDNATNAGTGGRSAEGADMPKASTGDTKSGGAAKTENAPSEEGASKAPK